MSPRATTHKDYLQHHSKISNHAFFLTPLFLVLLPLPHPYLLYRKLLEGEETRIGTGITYPSAPLSTGVGQGYSYQTRIYTSSSNRSKKESKEEDQPQQSKPAGKVSQREVYEETVVSSKKMEKQQEEVPTNQKN